MRIALGVVFAILLALELSLVVAVVILLIDGAVVGWERSPVTTVLVGLALALAGVGLYRSARVRVAGSSGGTDVHSGINFSRVPVSGAGGAIFMLQFVIWVVLAPEVGLLYAVLIAGGVALLPVAFYVNRRHGRGLASVGLGTVLGVVAALMWVSVASFRHTPLAWILPVAVPAGVLGAGLLVWKHSGDRHVSIAPYEK